MATSVKVWGEIDGDIFKAQLFYALQIQLIAIGEAQEVKHRTAIKTLLPELRSRACIDAVAAVEEAHLIAANPFQVQTIATTAPFVDICRTQRRTSIGVHKIISGFIAKVIQAKCLWLNQCDLFTEGFKLDRVVLTASSQADVNVVSITLTA